MNAAGRSTRVRRSVGEARETILAAAERRLIVSGPDAVRVQTIARDVGMSDAAVHYHFGSRDGLMEALLRRAGRQLREELVELAEAWDPETLDVDALIVLFEDCYDRRQYARLTAWMTLNGWRPTGSGMLRGLADAFHDARSARAIELGAHKPKVEDTLFVLELVHLFVWAKSLVGTSGHRMVGLPADRATDGRFSRWFGRLLTHHLDCDPRA